MASQNNYRGGKYGTAGKSAGGDGVTRKYGKDAAKAGARGERQLAYILEHNHNTSNYMMWKSLRIPYGVRSGKRYDSDVDLAMASGNRLILIDCKMWAGKKIYWSFMGKPMKGIAPMNSKLSKNMQMALAKYRAELPGIQVDAIVVFVPAHRNGALPTSVGMLRWPGGIKSYLPQDAIHRIKRFLSVPTEPNAKIQSLLSRMTR